MGLLLQLVIRSLESPSNDEIMIQVEGGEGKSILHWGVAKFLTLLRLVPWASSERQTHEPLIDYNKSIFSTSDE
jgi:hypothetical protein